MSHSYYDNHAEDFIRQTIGVDMSALYRRFLAHLPDGGAILDAGCGSGRDAKTFREMHYSVTAFDASEAMCRSASLLLGEEVRRLRFQDIEWQETFDGVWACASLLHVPMNELGDCFIRLLRAVRSSGVIYASFKHGSGVREKLGRVFLDMTEDRLRAALSQFHDISDIEVWITHDVRSERRNEFWLNALIYKN